MLIGWRCWRTAGRAVIARHNGGASLRSLRKCDSNGANVSLRSAECRFLSVARLSFSRDIWPGCELTKEALDPYAETAYLHTHGAASCEKPLAGLQDPENLSRWFNGLVGE
jgi:hypothetical protein